MGARRAVVTGASSGIGEATARLLAAHGWQVVGVARRADRLAELAEDTGIHAIVADLTSPEDVERVRAEVAAGGPVHALINNAGGAFGQATVEESDPDDWLAMFQINVIAVKRMITAMLPLLRAGARDATADGSPAHADILTITSIAGHLVYEGGGGYHAAKFGSTALMQTLRLELAGEPIRVVEVAPGMVRTAEFSTTRFRGDQARADAVYQGVEHPLSAEDVADTIVHTLELPGHINLDEITIKPVAQASTVKVIRVPLVPKGSGV